LRVANGELTLSGVLFVGGVMALAAVANVVAIVTDIKLMRHPPALQTVEGKATASYQKCTSQTEQRCRIWTMYFHLDNPTTGETRFAVIRGQRGFKELNVAIAENKPLRLGYYREDCGFGPTCWPVSVSSGDEILFEPDAPGHRSKIFHHAMVVVVCGIVAAICLLTARRDRKERGLKAGAGAIL
jgi:hypothetical protein